MKTIRSGVGRLCSATVLGLAIVIGVGSPPAAAVTFDIAPASVSNTYAGAVTLQIGGLINGETVVVDEFLDANANSVIDAPDLLMQSLRLTDGQASVIGGVTNVNVAGDSTPADGAITVRLNFASVFILQKLTGPYLLRLSSPTVRFASVTKAFTITSPVYGQSFTGTVRSGGVSVPYAMVLAFTGPTGNSSPAAGVWANSVGGYSIQLPAGNYGLAALQLNYLTDFGAPALTLGAGATVNANLALLATSQTIKGRVSDAANSSLGLSTLFVSAKSTNNLFAIGYTDVNGGFTLGATPSLWGIGDSDGLQGYGYVGLGDRVQADTTTGSVAGVSIALPKATALIYGYVKDDQNHPLPRVQLFPNNDQYEGRATTDQNGYYVAGVLAGDWYVNPDNTSAGYGSYIFTRANVTTSNGQSVRQDCVGKLGSHQISGYVKDDSDHPVANAGVWGNANINGADYNQWTETDANGHYSFSVASGTWTVGVDCGGCDRCLDTLGYQCVANLNTNVVNSDLVLSFTVTPINSGSWWSGASDLGSGWKRLGWFGDFAPYDSGWLWHGEHGWLYAVGTSTSSLWLWSSRLGWVWTSDTVYPFLWSDSAQAWLWYYKGTGDTTGGWFYNFGTSQAEWE